MDEVRPYNATERKGETFHIYQRSRQKKFVNILLI